MPLEILFPGLLYRHTSDFRHCIYRDCPALRILQSLSNQAGLGDSATILTTGKSSHRSWQRVARTTPPLRLSTLVGSGGFLWLVSPR